MEIDDFPLSQEEKANLRKAIIIEKIKAQGVAYNESNKATIEYGKMSLRGTFILNGASAIALINTNDIINLVHIVYFAIGSLLAVIATGPSYISQYLITESWRASIDVSASYPNMCSAWEKYAIKHTRRGTWFLWASALLIALSYISFAIGAYASLKRFIEVSAG